MKRVIFILTFLLTADFLAAQTDSSNLIFYKDKGKNYAVLYYKKISYSNPQITVVYSNETTGEENLNEKFKMGTDTTAFNNHAVLMLCFKYLNSKGYNLVSSTSEFFDFKLTNSLRKEFYFVKQK